MKRWYSLRYGPPKTITVPVEIAKGPDTYRGWIRVPFPVLQILGLTVGAYVRIRRGPHTIYTQVQVRIDTSDAIEMDDCYLRTLALPLLKREETQLTFWDGGLPARWRTLSSHPNDVVRLSLSLGILSVTLGALSVFLTATPWPRSVEFWLAVLLFVVGSILALAMSASKHVGADVSLRSAEPREADQPTSASEEKERPR